MAGRGKNKPRVYLALPSFFPQDAVGNDVLGMWRTLEAAGYPTTIVARWKGEPYEKLTVPLNVNDPAWRSRDDILIYHHAINWEQGEELLERTRTKTAIRYHNVTPPRYFAGYVDYYRECCERGVAITSQVAQRPDTYYWGTSQFNARELIALGAPEERCRVIPPCHRIEEELAGVPFDSVIAGDTRARRVNVLFVGAVRPNKGHARAVEAFASYRRISDAPARLVFAGKLDPKLQRYVDDVQARAADLNVAGDVRFACSLSPAQLRAYYQTSTVFLCTSEHEGFCVPLVEAMFFRLPIVAWDTAAIGETCGPAGLLFREFEPARLAEAIDECAENSAISLQLAECGRQRYETRFHPRAVEARLLELVRELEQL